MKLKGHTELFVAKGRQVVQEPYDGMLVVTAHTIEQKDDPNWPDDLTRELEQFMRHHQLSRLEAYWNAVPEEEI